MAPDANRKLYLDYAATTPLAPAVAEAMLEAARLYPANPASQHEPGRQARRALEAARDRIAELLGARRGRDADLVVFTSGGTEANNLALAGLGQPGGRLLISAAEHSSVREFAQQQCRQGRGVEVLPIDRNGLVVIDQLEAALDREEPVALASIQLGSNETGVVQPIARLAKLCRANDTLLHTDAIQAIGKVEVNFQQLGVAAMSVAAHKFYGPVGIGALIVRNDVGLQPLMWGGFQQAGRRPGTEPVALAVGMAAALEQTLAARQSDDDYLRRLGERLEATLLAGDVDAQVVGRQAERLPHVTTVAFPGIDRQALVMALDVAGIACSTGSACASGSSEQSPTLLSMGLSEAEIDGAIRLSWGTPMEAADMDLAGRRILSAVRHLRQFAPA